MKISLIPNYNGKNADRLYFYLRVVEYNFEAHFVCRSLYFGKLIFFIPKCKLSLTK